MEIHEYAGTIEDLSSLYEKVFVKCQHFSCVEHTPIAFPHTSLLLTSHLHTSQHKTKSSNALP